MSGADVSLLVGLLLALALSIRHPRACGWLLAAAASYTVSTLYWRTGLPYGAFIAGLCDALICLAVYFFAKYRWEMWVWRVFQVSVLVNIFYLASTFGVVWKLSHNDYSIILEAINWIALLFLGGTGALQPLGAIDAPPAAGGFAGRIRRLVRPLYRERKEPAFHKASR